MHGPSLSKVGGVKEGKCLFPAKRAPTILLYLKSFKILKLYPQRYPKPLCAICLKIQDTPKSTCCQIKETQPAQLQPHEAEKEIDLEVDPNPRPLKRQKLLHKVVPEPQIKWTQTQQSSLVPEDARDVFHFSQDQEPPLTRIWSNRVLTSPKSFQ